VYRSALTAALASRRSTGTSGEFVVERAFVGS
jgi:hypothetical protein